MGTASTAAPERARWPRLTAAPRPRLRPLLAGGYAGFTEATGGAVPIGRIADEVGWSHKHLIARFRQQVGLRPKTAARLVRLNRVWRRLDERRPLDWGQVAADAGYADQAHLIRDFHQFTGTTPTRFQARTLPFPWGRRAGGQFRSRRRRRGLLAWPPRTGPG
jgi:transcriptional regulator GlxA family with amidase domain